MQKVRTVVGDLFSAPMGNMNFVSYFQYVNTSGKITAKSLLDLSTALFIFAEEQEAKNEQYEANFKEIQEILVKLVEERKMPKFAPTATLGNTATYTGTTTMTGADPSSNIVGNVPPIAESPVGGPLQPFQCHVCGKQLKNAGGLTGHLRSHK